MIITRKVIKFEPKKLSFIDEVIVCPTRLEKLMKLSRASQTQHHKTHIETQNDRHFKQDSHGSDRNRERAGGREGA